MWGEYSCQLYRYVLLMILLKAVTQIQIKERGGGEGGEVVSLAIYPCLPEKFSIAVNKICPIFAVWFQLVSS